MFGERTYSNITKGDIVDVFISIVVLMEKKALIDYSIFNITDVFKNERNQVGVSPGQNEQILNASLSSVIMKTITYAVNNYISLVISTREKYSEVTVLSKW